MTAFVRSFVRSFDRFRSFVRSFVTGGNVLLPIFRTTSSIDGCIVCGNR